MCDKSSEVSITVLLPAGRLPLDIMKTAHELAEKYHFSIYFSLAQNMRMINVPESAVEDVRTILAALGAKFKSPGQFPLPRICIGKPHCNLGLVDTEQLNQKILERFGDLKNMKAKFKISIAGCPAGCSWPQNTDISIMATRRGYSISAGGKGGLVPRVARRIKKRVTETEVLDTIATLVNFHDQKTKTKQRISQLLDDPDFPFPAV
jgi:sulfite reductase beta subunit-like hemoprotein